MKRGLLTLAIVAIALLCNSVYAYAPIIGDIPDVYIGDREDNLGRPPGVDINFFRFTNAFNFDKYVTKDPGDEDQSTTNVRWSFIIDPAATGMIQINGIDGLSDPADSLQPDLVGKELTSYPNNNPDPGPGRDTSWASFRDLKDSPGSPPWGPPSSPLDTQITIYVSNGAKATSTTIQVKARMPEGTDLDAPDKLSGEAWTKVKTWADPATDGFTSLLGYTGGVYVGRTADGKPFYTAAATTSGGSIGSTTSSTQFQWGYWQSPTGQVPYVADQLYRIAYQIRSTAAYNQVPNCRLLTNFVGPSILAVAAGNRVGKGLVGIAPDADGNTYNVYIGPPDLTAVGVNNLTVFFEVIDFDNNEVGTNYLDQVDIDRRPIPAIDPSKLVRTYAPPFTSATWLPITLGSPFGSATLGSSGTGLSIQTAATPVTPVSGQIDYGSWYLLASNSPDSFVAGKLYRCVYTLQKSTGANIGKVRMINANGAGDWSGKFCLVNDAALSSHMPSTTGTQYSNWYETMPALYGDAAKNKMSYQIDVSDGKVAQVGILYLTKIELYAYDIP